MNANRSKVYLLSEEKVSRALLKLGIPTMIGMMTSALYNLVDAFFVSKLGTSQMGAVAVVFPLSVILLGIGLMFGAGASSYISRLLGDNRYEEANICASTSLFTGMATGGVVIMIILLFLHPILRMLGTTDTILPYATEYAILFVIGLLFNVVNITVNNIITSEGAAFYSMIAMLFGGIINMIVDPILIFGFDMGVKGAAIATLISRVVSFSLFFYFILSGKGILKFSMRYFKPNVALYRELFKIGVPAFVYQFLISVSLSITNSLAAQYGDSAIAAIGVVSRLLSLGNMALFGFLKGYQPFVGFNYGAGNMSRVKEATRVVLKWTTLFGLGVAIALVIFRIPLMKAFSKNDNQVVAIGSMTLIFNAIVFIGLGYQTVYATLFLALGKSKESGLVSIGRQGLFFMPLAFGLSALFQLNGLILAQPLADVCSIIMVYVLSKRQSYDVELVLAK